MEKHFEFKEALVSYRIYGSGITVILVHGFAEDGTIWKEQAQYLQPHCQVIVPDLPGSGKSQLLRGDGIAMEDFANCINRLLEVENIENCILLGHSMGGYITLAFAEKFPAKLTAFGFIHSTAFADTPDKKTTRIKAIQFIKEHGVYPFLKNSTPNLFSASYKKDQPEKVIELIELGRSFSKEALIQYYTALINRPDRTRVLERSAIPVLFIIGSEDVAAPLDDLLRQVHLPKVSFIHIIENVGHMSMLEKPKELNEFLLQFIREASERD